MINDNSCEPIIILSWEEGASPESRYVFKQDTTISNNFSLLLKPPSPQSNPISSPWPSAWRATPASSAPWCRSASSETRFKLKASLYLHEVEILKSSAFNMGSSLHRPNLGLLLLRAELHLQALRCADTHVIRFKRPHQHRRLWLRYHYVYDG